MTATHKDKFCKLGKVGGSRVVSAHALEIKASDAIDMARIIFNAVFRSLTITSYSRFNDSLIGLRFLCSIKQALKSQIQFYNFCYSLAPFK